MATQATADEVTELLNVALAGRSMPHRRITRMIITGTMDAAARAEKIGRHKLTGIRPTEGTRTPPAPDDDDDDEAGGFVTITDVQVMQLVEGMTVTDRATGRKRTLAGVGIAAWLQRTMGLRIREALGVEKADFRTRKNGERYLRLRSQATRDGRGRAPLKHRREGEGRNVPVPDYVWNIVQAMPDGPLCPGPRGSRYMQYGTARVRFAAIMDAAGVDGYTTHSLRHQFASECLDDGMNIMDLSAVLGHADPSVTLRTYVHAMPDAEQRTRALMNSRWPARPALKTAA
jgi:integrase